MSRYNYLENLAAWIMILPGRFTAPTKDELWAKVIEACPIALQHSDPEKGKAEFIEALRVLGHTARPRQRYDGKGNVTKDSYWELPLPADSVRNG